MSSGFLAPNTDMASGHPKLLRQGTQLAVVVHICILYIKNCKQFI